MKKYISVGIAVLLVLAMGATAYAAADISGPSSVEPGETIELTVTGGNNGMSANVSTSGLEFVSASGSLSDASHLIILQDAGGMSVNYTYRVTASSGTVSFSLRNVTQSTEDGTTKQPNASWSASVEAAEPTATPSPTAAPSDDVNPTEAPGENPSEQPSESPSESASPGASGGTGTTPGGQGGSGTSSGQQDKMPKTGDTTVDLWMLLAVAAGAAITAIIAGKKMFTSR